MKFAILCSWVIFLSTFAAKAELLGSITPQGSAQVSKSNGTNKKCLSPGSIEQAIEEWGQANVVAGNPNNDREAGHRHTQCECSARLATTEAIRHANQNTCQTRGGLAQHRTAYVNLSPEKRNGNVCVNIQFSCQNDENSANLLEETPTTNSDTSTDSTPAPDSTTKSEESPPKDPGNPPEDTTTDTQQPDPCSPSCEPQPDPCTPSCAPVPRPHAHTCGCGHSGISIQLGCGDYYYDRYYRFDLDVWTPFDIFFNVFSGGRSYNHYPRYRRSHHRHYNYGYPRYGHRSYRNKSYRRHYNSYSYDYGYSKRRSHKYRSHRGYSSHRRDGYRYKSRGHNYRGHNYGRRSYSRGHSSYGRHRSSSWGRGNRGGYHRGGHHGGRNHGGHKGGRRR